MKAKRAVRVFVFGLFFFSLFLISLLFYLELTGKLKDRYACIVLPNEGGYVESWAPYLTQLSRVLGVSDLSIKTYTHEKDLHELISKADLLNILWIEIPLNIDYSLEKEIINNQLIPLLDAQTVLSSSPPVVQSIFLSHFSDDKQNLYALPFTMNPLVQIYKLQDSENDKKNSLVLALQSPEELKNFLSFSRTYFHPYLKDIDEKEFLQLLPSLLQHLQLDKNSLSFSKNDIIQYFFKNNHKTLLLRASDLGNFSVEQRLSVTISNLGKTIASDFSYIVFPKRTSDTHKERIKAAQEHLLIPELAFNIASKRNSIPVNLESISKNVFNDFIKKQVRQAENCVVPGLEKNIENKDEFLQTIKKSL